MLPIWKSHRSTFRKQFYKEALEQFIIREYHIQLARPNHSGLFVRVWTYFKCHWGYCCQFFLFIEHSFFLVRFKSIQTSLVYIWSQPWVMLMKRLITDYEFSWVSSLPTRQNAWNVILQFLQCHFFAAMLVFASVVWQKTILDDEFMNFMKIQSNSLADSGHTLKKGKIFRVKMRPRILFLRPEFLKSSGRKLRVLIFIGKSFFCPLFLRQTSQQSPLCFRALRGLS